MTLLKYIKSFLLNIGCGPTENRNNIFVQITHNFIHTKNWLYCIPSPGGIVRRKRPHYNLPFFWLALYPHFSFDLTKATCWNHLLLPQQYDSGAAKLYDLQLDTIT
jgi:hypothetical protein